jgi:hypothetical protein
MVGVMGGPDKVVRLRYAGMLLLPRSGSERAVAAVKSMSCCLRKRAAEQCSGEDVAGIMDTTVHARIRDESGKRA